MWLADGPHTLAPCGMHAACGRSTLQCAAQRTGPARLRFCSTFRVLMHPPIFDASPACGEQVGVDARQRQVRIVCFNLATHGPVAGTAGFGQGQLQASTMHSHATLSFASRPRCQRAYGSLP